MTFETVYPMWEAVRSRFTKTVTTLTEEELSLKLGETSIGQLVYHTGEVEYIFAEWYFEEKSKDIEQPSLTDKEELLHYLEAANQFLIAAMRKLPEEKWHEARETRMGSSTPLEIVGRLMYHTGIHSGQISDIKKYGA